MEKVLKIEKQPIIEEDLGLENTPIIQFRDEKEVWVTPIKMFKIVDNLQQLRVADFNKYSQGIVFGGVDGSVGNNSFYKWFPDNIEPENLPDIVTSELSATGRWIRQDIGGGGGGTVGNFVTTDTEQDIEPTALKNWLNFNKFLGHSQAGQIALIKDQSSPNLMLSLCETNEADINAHIGYPKRTSTTLEIFNELGGEIAFNRDIVLSDRNNPDLTKVAFIGFTTNNLDNLIIKNEKSDKLYIANSIFGVDTNYTPKFSISSNNTNLEVSNLDSGAIEFNADLNFSGGRKLINNVNTPAEGHQATPKDYVDTADENLQDQIDANTQEIADTNTRIDAIDEKLIQLAGSSVVIGQINQTKDAVELDRENILNAFVQQVKSRAPKEGDSVYTTDNYAYYRLATAWSAPYTISINIANTTTAGLVLSTENIDSNRGFIYVDPMNGKMQVIGNLVYANTNQTITGEKTFNGRSYYTLTPTGDTEIANKKYVDDKVAGGGGSTPANMVTTDTTQTITGQKTFSGLTYYSKTPTTNNELANKKYVDDAVAAGGGGGGNYVTLNTQQIITGTKCMSSNRFYIAPSATLSHNVPFAYWNRGSDIVQVLLRSDNSYLSLETPSPNSIVPGGENGSPSIQWSFKGVTNKMAFLSNQKINFFAPVILANAQFGTVIFALDPEWEQDYATANYVNQKLQELYDHIDARLKAIEQALNIPTTFESRAIKAMIDEIVVPKSKVTTLYEELNTLAGYEGLIGMSTSEERKQIFSTTDRVEQLRILDEIKARKEEAERQQAELDKQRQQEQNSI